MSAVTTLYKMIVLDEEREKVEKLTKERTMEAHLTNVIFDAYAEITYELFKDIIAVDNKEENISKFMELAKRCAETGEIYNIAERKFDTNVLSSIQSDITILETVSKIVGIMATCNQFILPTAMHNIYMNP